MLLPQVLDLPYEDWQPEQWETISKLVATTKKFVALEAPTGIGKSGIVTGYAALMGYRFVVCTGTKQLQDQYASSLGLADVRGRSNFPCLIEPVQADQAPCTAGGACDNKIATRHAWQAPVDHTSCDPCERELPHCPYYEQRYAGEHANKAVLNYAYFLTMTNYAGAFGHRDLTVFDEAHTLEDEIRRFATVRFSRSQATSLGLLPCWADPDDIAGWQDWCRDAMRVLRPEFRMYSRGGGSLDSEEDKKHRQAVLGFWRQAEMFTSLDASGWVGVPVEIRGVKIGATEFKPVWVGPIAPLLVYRHTGEKVIFMSGTILDRDVFARQIGVELDEIDFIQVPSTFDPKLRPLYYQPMPAIKWRNQASVDAGILAIDDIIDKYPDKSGIIHTVSHALAKLLIQGSRHTRRMIGHETKDKDRQLELFRRTPGAIWISPSSGTGVDLPYDLCRWQILAKLPFPDLGDKQIKQAMKHGPDGRPAPSASQWYNWLTLCNLIQMYGRGMRAPDDQCDSYLLDDNWRWFRSATRPMIPAWFKRAIINPPPVIVEPYDLWADLKKSGVGMS